MKDYISNVDRLSVINMQLVNKYIDGKPCKHRKILKIIENVVEVIILVGLIAFVLSIN